MKKTLVALAALAATASFAQSSVTISGIMDVGVTYANNVNTGANKLNLGPANNNRIIFSGVEDLGGGMAATFAAQMRFSPLDGNSESSGARPLFQGETRVGLRGGFGHIRLGRGLTALQAPNGGYIDPWGVSTVAGSVYAAGFATDYRAGGEGRTDGIFYDSPNLSGFGVSVTLSPRKIGNVAAPALPASYGKTLNSIALTYNNGPLQLLIGQENNRHGDSLFNLGGNYNMGVAKIYAGYGLVKGGTAAERAAAAGTAYAATSASLPTAQTAAGAGVALAANGRITSTSIGVAVPMGATTIRAGYSRLAYNTVQGAATTAGTNRSDAKIGLGVQYDLSKRTSLYSDFASWSRNNNAAGANKLTNNSRVTQMDFGVTHRF